MMVGSRATRAVLVRAIAGLAIAAAALRHPEAAFLGPITTALLDVSQTPRHGRRSLR